MTAISIRFLAGRYHATGWDHHVNEGVPEWPPAPWRFLRCLVAASYRMVRPPARAELGALLTALQSPPSYCLPAVKAAHTRHYMPTLDSTKLVFDSFVAVGDGGGDRGGEILIGWPTVRLSDAQRDLLDQLLEHVNYLGRAESWVECALLASTPMDYDARPVAAEEVVRHEARILGALEGSAYQSWRDGFLAGRGSASGPVPPEGLLELLEFDTLRLHSERWSAMPGVRWLRYAFSADPFRAASRPHAVAQSRVLPNLARYAVSSAVLPSMEDAVLIGERMRQALLAHSRNQEGLSHSVFLGRDEFGEPMRGHRHAFFLPEDADGDGRIDHITVWARGGFDQAASAALRSVSRLWGSTGHELWLALVGMGVSSDYGTSIRGATPGASTSCGRARVWRSATPFVPPRHAKERKGVWSDLPHQQLRALLGRHGLEPAEILALPDLLDGPGSRRWSRFRRRRRTGEASPGMDQGIGFEVRFADPVEGPIAVGYGAHFGLGRFEAVE